MAFFIAMLGIETIKSSIDKIINPEMVSYNYITIMVLVFSIIAKLFLYYINIKLSKKINSTVMKAVATDSISDVIATSSVLIATIVSPLIGFSLDGYMGVVVALFILKAGYEIVKESSGEILGKACDDDLSNEINSYIKNYDEIIIGTHDLVVHNYGGSRKFATVHAEVPANEDLMKSHDIIDNIEKDVMKEFHVSLVIHLDPIVVNDEETNRVRKKIIEIIANIDKDFSIHDFRMVKGETHSNLIFDLEIPFECQIKGYVIIEQINLEIAKTYDNFYTVITIDRK